MTVNRFLILFLALVFLLPSCNPDKGGIRLNISVINHTAETLDITYGSPQGHTSVSAGRTVGFSIGENDLVTAVGETSGRQFGPRYFATDGEFWDIF